MSVKICFNILLFIFLTRTLFAYDLQYTCSQNGQLEGYQFAPKSAHDQIQNQKTLTFADKKANICDDLSRCFGEFKEIGRLTGQTYEILTHIQETHARVENTTDDEQLDQEIAHMQTLLGDCLDFKGISFANVSKKTITLVYPFNGPNKNKSSVRYDTNEISSIIDIAIKEGVDPFALLAIKLTEDPPLKSEDRQNEYYYKSYGFLPIDQIAIFDTLNCELSKKSSDFFEPDLIRKLGAYTNKIDQLAVERKKLGLNQQSESDELLQRIGALEAQVSQILPDPKMRRAYRDLASCKTERGDCYGVFKNQRSIPHYVHHEGTSSKKYTLCDINTRINVSDPARFSTNEKPGCCATIQAKDGLDQKELNGLIKQHIGVDYFKKRIQSSSSNNISLALQKYNGLSCFGCTEILSNDCLNKIYMGDRPVYGAKAADLMVNTLMRNPEIQRLVLEKQKQTQKPIISMLCLKDGVGTHSISDKTYLEEQKTYLLQGDQKFYKARFEQNGRVSFRSAQTEQEKQDYLETEKERKVICEKDFK